MGLQALLIKQGIMNADFNYLTLVEAHAHIQFFLSLGFFLIGFCLHALPKVLQTEIKASKALAWIIFSSIVLGAFSALLFGKVPLAKIPTFCGYLFTLIFLLKVFLIAEREARERVGILAVSGLAVLSVGIFLDVRTPSAALTLLWAGVGSLVLAASQQFLFAFVGCRKLTVKESRYLIVIHLLGIIFLLKQSFHDFGVVLLFEVLYFLYAVRSWRVLSRFGTLMGASFGFCFLWILCAAASLIVSSHNLDRVIHALGLGMAYTVIIGTSSQILGFMNLKPLLPERASTFLIYIWQFAVLGRVLQSHPLSTHWVTEMTGLALLLVTIVWGGCVLKTSLELRQRANPSSTRSR